MPHNIIYKKRLNFSVLRHEAGVRAPKNNPDSTKLVFKAQNLSFPFAFTHAHLSFALSTKLTR